MTLGLADWYGGNLDVYDGQLLCAGAVLGACCLAPVQARRSVAPLSLEKHNGFSTLFLSAQIVLLVASGRSLVGPEGPWMSLQGCLEVAPEPFWVPSSWILLHDSSARIPPSGFHLKDSSSRIPFAGFPLQASTSRIPPPGFLLQDSSSRTPPQRFLLKDSPSRIPPSGFLLKDCP